MGQWAWLKAMKLVLQLGARAMRYVGSNLGTFHHVFDTNIFLDNVGRSKNVSFQGGFWGL